MPDAAAHLARVARQVFDGWGHSQRHAGPRSSTVHPERHRRCWVAPRAARARPRTEADVCVGDVHALGTALLQVAQPRSPCWNIARRWRVPDLPARVQRTGRTGWYYRVSHAGHVEAGQDRRVLERPHPEWTVAAVNAVRYERKADTPEDRAVTLALAACPALATSLRETLTRRALHGVHRDDTARLVGPNATPRS